jgi:hypothetical protein
MALKFSGSKQKCQRFLVLIKYINQRYSRVDFELRFNRDVKHVVELQGQTIVRKRRQY